MLLLHEPFIEWCGQVMSLSQIRTTAVLHASCRLFVTSVEHKRRDSDHTHELMNTFELFHAHEFEHSHLITLPQPDQTLTRFDRDLLIPAASRQ